MGKLEKVKTPLPEEGYGRENKRLRPSDLSKEDKEFFKNYMKVNKVDEKDCNSPRNPYVKIAKLLNNKDYTSRQLCHFWRNYLDPELSHKPLSIEEKKYIIKWVSGKRVIKWVELREDLKKNVSGLLRSENVVKNFWYSKKRTEKNQKDKMANPESPGENRSSSIHNDETNAYAADSVSMFQQQIRLLDDTSSKSKSTSHDKMIIDGDYLACQRTDSTLQPFHPEVIHPGISHPSEISYRPEISHPPEFLLPKPDDPTFPELPIRL